MTVVVLAECDFDDVELEQDRLAAAGIELVQAASSKPGDVMRAAPDAEGLLVQWSRADSDVMDLLPQLRAIGRFGTGVDPIDVDEASRRGIAVVNSGHYATDDVAAHTLALVLALVRHVPQGAGSVRAGRWEPLVVATGIQHLSDVSVGLIGLGHIGRLVARHLSGLGMRVFAYDTQAADPPPGTTLVESLDDLLRASDVVSLHVPLIPSTANLLSRQRIALMRPGAMVVNTSRGGTLDEEALCDALLDGRLSGAALDVFASEPLPADSRLREFDSVLLTPHIAYYSDGSLLEARSRTLESLVAVLLGEPVPNLVNPGYAASIPKRSA